MDRSWKHFAFVQLPVAALILALGAQAIAAALSRVPRWLFLSDQLALAVSSEPANYRVLLLGDSKTSRATARFALGAPSDTVNLSTNMFVGLSGSLFLVQRYLEVDSVSEHVRAGHLCLSCIISKTISGDPATSCAETPSIAPMNAAS